MITYIDNFLNKITMYKLVLYTLTIFIGIAVFFSAIGKLPFNPIALIFSSFLITCICYITNIIFAWAFEAPTNIESVYITAFILILLITPPQNAHDMNYFILAVWSSLWAVASKYIFAIGKKHIFNPAAFGIAITALVLNTSATWWVGTYIMLPFVLIGGILITRKIRRFDLVISFIIISIISIILSHSTAVKDFAGLLHTLFEAVAYTPIVFFATVMLTEPLTTPSTKGLRVWYGALVGALFAPAIHIGSIYSTPELDLLVGNIFSYIISPKKKLFLKLKKASEIARDTHEFIFEKNTDLDFYPGQYVEWTLPHDKPDSRGNRRYFTIASSPTESHVHLSARFYSPSSSFKTKLLDMKPQDVIVASQLSGDFILPKNSSQKLVFVAGGIGITPFRSMVKYIIDKKERRDIIMIYSNKHVEDIAYKEFFDEANSNGYIKVHYVLTDADATPEQWLGMRGYITEEMIRKLVPDFNERLFYISGPNSMVVSTSDILHSLSVPRTHIKKDYFPGF